MTLWQCLVLGFVLASSVWWAARAKGERQADDSRRTKTLDDTTLASAPGRLQISPRKYELYLGDDASERWLLRMGMKLPWSARHIPLLGEVVYLWQHYQEYFRNGNLNPAMIVDVDCNRVAVFGNLSSHRGPPTDVIKIIEERLDLVPAARRKNGARFASVALYSKDEGDERPGRWTDFFPIVVDCLVDDSRACYEAMSRLDERDWAELEAGLDVLGDAVYELGLHDVTLPDELDFIPES